MNNIIHLDSVSSTNDYLKNNYEIEPYTLVYADEQTSGRGRMGRTWEGTIGKNIYASINVPKINNDFNLYPLVAAVAIHKILIKYVHDSLIKWPNDILYNHQKLCGILCESKTDSPFVIVGFGINVNQVDFNPELNATSLKLINGNEYSLPYIIEELYVSIANEFEMFFSGFKSYLSYLQDHLFGLNEEVSYVQDNETKQGIIIGIEQDGRLIINHNGEIDKLLSGEIKIIR